MTKVCPKCKTEKQHKEFSKGKSRKDGFQGWCKLCIRGYAQKNKKEIAKNKKKYYEENKEDWAKKSKIYRDNNKEIIIERQKRYYEANKELIKNKVKEYRKTETGKFTKSKSEHKRRVQRKNLVNDLTLEQWYQILKDQHNKCNMCDRKFDEKLLPTKDHIIPVSKGGDFTQCNIQALCGSCNSKKGNK